MKNTIQGKIILLLLLCSIVFVSCQKNNDVGITTTDRDQFLGTWYGTTTGSNGQRSFTLTITASNSASDQILLRNFDGAGTGTYIPATVSGSSFTMTSTLIGSDRYNGTGSLSSGTMSFTFSIDDGQAIENRTGTAHK